MQKYRGETIQQPMNLRGALRDSFETGTPLFGTGLVFPAAVRIFKTIFNRI
jgi:hypothetical protein